MKAPVLAAGVLATAFLLLAVGFICGADIYYRVVDYKARRQAAREGNV